MKYVSKEIRVIWICLDLSKDISPFANSTRHIQRRFEGYIQNILERFWSNLEDNFKIYGEPSISIYTDLLILGIIQIYEMYISGYIKIAKMAYFGALKVNQRSILRINILCSFVALDLHFEINSYFMLLYAVKLKYISWIISNSTKMAKFSPQFCLQFTNRFFILKY